MNGVQDEPSGSLVSGIEGLPPLPKGLSGILNSSGGSWRDVERLYAKKTMIQDELSRPRLATENLLRNKPANLDAALALLRKEMVGLRQLDMSLLCQLWSLHESIQEYKGLYQDLTSSMHSYVSENADYDDDDEYEAEQDCSDRCKDEAVHKSLKVPQTQNSRDKWLQDSFHITI
ncbi:leucine repeat adapter protein 25 [Stegostoma tigrinum]|uniref:leucine repeat adapter protein 25 n=1 Tax=Stegostoma tigrinum TaxID=3053191 RepID=UPI00202B75E8|nr:leucine repeat adapter protein 25 [Stegostoma tigrinum]